MASYPLKTYWVGEQPMQERGFEGRVQAELYLTEGFLSSQDLTVT